MQPVILSPTTLEKSDDSEAQDKVSMDYDIRPSTSATHLHHGNNRIDLSSGYL